MRELIAKYLPLFFESDDVFEVRALDVEKPKQSFGGFVRVRDIEYVSSKIVALADRGGSIYFTPQKLNPNVLERSPANHLPRITKDDDGNAYPRLTHDEDVTARRFLLIDVDPVKPHANRHDSATDAEREGAWEVVERARKVFVEYETTAPLVIDSGNGFHLYYRLSESLPGGRVDSETDPLAQLLRVLKSKLDTSRAVIDPSVFNASRIMKVPGTIARKGRSSVERPHRQCKVLEVPDGWN